MKRTGIIALLALLFAGCSITPERFSDAPVDKDAPVYLSCQPASLAEDWSKYCDSVIERESRNPQNSQTQVIRKFLYIKMLMHYSGINSIDHFKASSTPVPDGRFDNRAAIAVSGDKQDQISLFGENRDLYTALAELPQVSSFVMAFSINVAPAWEAVQKSRLELKNRIIANAKTLLRTSPAELAESHNGIWIIGAVNPEKDESLFLSFPDKDKKMYSQLNRIANSRKKQYVTIEIAPIRLHIRHKDGRSFIFNSEKYLENYFSSPRKLGDNPEFAKLAKAAGSPAVFLSWTSATNNTPADGSADKTKPVQEYFTCGRTEYGFYAQGLEKNNWMTELFRDDLMAVINWLPFPGVQQEYVRSQSQTDKTAVVQMHSAKCNANMHKIASALKVYASAHHGSFPEGMHTDGLNKLVSTPAWNNEFLCCPDSGCEPAQPGKPVMAENTGYVYFGNWEKDAPKDLPLIIDIPENHNGFFYAVLNDGSVKKFIFKQQMSLKRMASYMHTVFRYDEKYFSELIRRAEELDKILYKGSK